MSYFEFDDVRRLHVPYTDPITKSSYWRPPPYNSPYQNWWRGLYASSTTMFFVESIRHFHANVTVLADHYEWPRTRMEYNIFFKEVFRLPEFWPELLKK